MSLTESIIYDIKINENANRTSISVYKMLSNTICQRHKIFWLCKNVHSQQIIIFLSSSI